MAIMAPSGCPLKTAGLQEKKPRGPGSVPFGGSNGLVCLGFGALADARSTATTGAWPSPTITGYQITDESRTDKRSTNDIVAPTADP